MRKIIALGQTDAEVAVLQWASENGIGTDAACVLAHTSLAFTPPRRNGRVIARRTVSLLKNVQHSDGTILLTLKSSLGPEPSKAIEFLGANKKAFLHLWSAVPQAGRLARHFLASHSQRPTIEFVGPAYYWTG